MVIRVRLRCSWCRKVHQEDVNVIGRRTRLMAVRQVREREGWTYLDGYDACPSCIKHVKASTTMRILRDGYVGPYNP